MNKQIELLAPAGNLEKAKIALMYGADAVYVGGKEYSLRARASNFTMEDLKELAAYAHEQNKKVYVTMNIIPHDEDLDDYNNLCDYLRHLEKIGISAIITSSLFIMKTAKEIVPNLEVHVSTQMSITNSEAIKFYEMMKATRVVLAREVSLNEMALIKANTNLEIEVFIHGGMCASYSGHCVLSNHMTLRDANRGGCAHSCRWNYHLYQGKKKLNAKGHFFNMGSKDLMALKYIPSLIDIGITSLKIEGRMKSAYYLATVVRCYRLFINKYLEKGFITEEEFKWYYEEILKAENRETGCGFYNGIPTINEQLYDTRDETPTKEYVGDVISYNEDNQTVLIAQRNYFMIGDELEFFGPHLHNTSYVVSSMIDAQTKEELTVARHPLQKIYIKVPFKVQTFDMIRKKFND